MNFVFISPTFPENYERFCIALKNNGVNVLGVAETPYDQISPALRGAMTEYYRVGSLHDYDQMVRALGYFTFKYGKIDFLESNNEYWLEQDARLREDFNITSGIFPRELEKCKFKSRMKEYYQKAGVPTARYQMASTLEMARVFIDTVGYPIIAKPDNGVGACNTYNICDDAQLCAFFQDHPDVPYIMEEFIDGRICSYDAIVNGKGEILFETGDVTLMSILDSVNNRTTVSFYMRPECALPEKLRSAGRRTIAAFGVKKRMVHLEFFELVTGKPNLGEPGDIVALEVNMRPCGGYSPDMMNYANSTDVYKNWADMICYDHLTLPDVPHKYFCAFVGRRDGTQYALSNEEICARYGDKIMAAQRLPKVLADGMGEYMILARLSTMEEMNEFFATAGKLK